VAIFFVTTISLLFGIDISNLSTINSITLSWVHLFLLGFVMMVIFGAMAQLAPVVLEVGHFAVDLYYVIYPLLFIGTLLMGYGFFSSVALLPYGGIVVLIALLIFVLETFLTIQKVKKFNLVMLSVLLANIFLFLGLIFGILMALGYAGTIDINISNLLKAHIYLVLAGYVGVTIMGMSLILLPMFWLSHSFSWRPVKIALTVISISVVCVMFSSFSENKIVEYIGYIGTIVALGLYFYQIYIIYKTRVRLDKDIYLYSLLFSYGSLGAVLILGCIYLVNPSESLLLTIGWVLFLGFITFLIVLSILVFVHELGHFTVARLLGVKVYVFSIGFGKRLITKHYKGTDWSFSLIPLGGYVKMKGQEDLNPALSNNDPDSYNTKTPFQRILILLAGPFANFLLAFVVYIMIGLLGNNALSPTIGKVIENYRYLLMPMRYAS